MAAQTEPRAPCRVPVHLSSGTTAGNFAGSLFRRFLKQVEMPFFPPISFVICLASRFCIEIDTLPDPLQPSRSRKSEVEMHHLYSHSVSEVLRFEVSFGCLYVLSFFLFYL